MNSEIIFITLTKSISLPLCDVLSAMGRLFRYRSICGIMATLLAFEVLNLPTPLNVFMNVEVHADGTLSIHPPRTSAGDSIVLSAEMDLAVALSACPASLCNGGSAKPLGYEIVDP
jgi:uncharacterized protein YcgI (DUF1989 family)